ncbi:MAG: hypothetical protein NT143_00075 [Actinobacteria bacterium]|nr:hypothetical protein [Actinomycetota bacterium]
MTSIRTRAALAAIPLALGALAIGAGSASANSTNWGNNGSATCTSTEGTWSTPQNGSVLGTYCMQSVTGFISIGAAASQQQAISCSNNDTASGLSWSVYNNTYVNDGPWYSLAWNDAGMGNQGTWQNVGWEVNGSGPNLTSESYFGTISSGSIPNGTYGVGGVGVTNFGGSGTWQAAIACMNAAGYTASDPDGNSSNERTAQSMERIAFPSTQSEDAAPVRIRDKTIDGVDKKSGKAFLAREYALKKNVTRTDTRTCPAGMVRKGKLAYTVQEFPANHKAPKWKNRSLVDITMTPKGKNAGMVSMTLTRATNPTVVQFQLRCAKA